MCYIHVTNFEMAALVSLCFWFAPTPLRPNSTLNSLSNFQLPKRTRKKKKKKLSKTATGAKADQSRHHAHWTPLFFFSEKSIF